MKRLSAVVVVIAVITAACQTASEQLTEQILQLANRLILSQARQLVGTLNIVLSQHFLGLAHSSCEFIGQWCRVSSAIIEIMIEQGYLLVCQTNLG